MFSHRALASLWLIKIIKNTANDGGVFYSHYLDVSIKAV